jgi:hypothetical protein
MIESDAIAPPAEAPQPVAEASTRGADLVLAGLHLRMGSLSLARAELETLAGIGALDVPGSVDLAEARWRTGDLVGAGEIAREVLAGGHEAVVVLVIASEAAAGLGRPSEARKLAGLALTLADGPIDPVFAGMPRSAVWPADPAELVPSPATLFPPDRSAHPGDDAAPSDDAAAADEEDVLHLHPGPLPDDPGLWDQTDPDLSPVRPVWPPPPPTDPAELLGAGQRAIAAGDLATAAVVLGLVVRLAPSSAPAVLDVIGETGDPGLQLVRGDAFRAVGHEVGAMQSYGAAMAASQVPSEPPADH